MYSFPLQDNEAILKKAHASLSVDNNSFTGALYLTNDRLVFVGYILDINNKHMEEIPLQHIRTVNKEKTFYLIPNVLVVETIRDRHVKFVVSERDDWFDTIKNQMTDN